MPHNWVVPREWEGQTAVCIATGPSLTQEDVDYVRDKAKVIAISDALLLAPWADVAYSCDAKWWRHPSKRFALKWPGLKVGLHTNIEFEQVHVLQYSKSDGFDERPTHLATGHNSGYQALHLAVHFGASTIILLGYDMGHDEGEKSHFFGSHPDALETKSPYKKFRRAFDTLKEPLDSLGVHVVNCTRRSKLETFPQLPLRAVL